MLARLYRPGDGDCGICFEYAVHDAISNGEPDVLERIDDALTRHCRVQGDKATSILFGAEKTGSQQLIDTTGEVLTDDSLLLHGRRGRPLKLKRHLNLIAAAFRRKGVRPALPYSISGLWKADLFLGKSDTDRWVGTTVKINPQRLESARGLRVGIVPAQDGQTESHCLPTSIRSRPERRAAKTAASWRSSTPRGPLCSSSSTRTRRCLRQPTCRRPHSAKSQSDCWIGESTPSWKSSKLCGRSHSQNSLRRSRSRRAWSSRGATM